MRKTLMALALLTVTILGAGCEETTNSPKVKGKPGAVERTEQTKPVVSQQTKFRAELLTISSAMGVLQGCRAKEYYTSPIVEDVFYRLATLMRPLATGPDTEMREFAHFAFQVYVMSGRANIFTTVTPTNDDLDKATVKNEDVDNEAACKKIEAFLKSKMAKGQVLDVPPAPEIKPGQRA